VIVGRTFFSALVFTALFSGALTAAPLKVVVQADPHLSLARDLTRAAFEAAGVEVEFEMAPLANEKRQLLLLEEGRTHVDLMPVTPERLRSVREGKSHMIPVPLDRGMLGYRLCLVLRSRQDLLAGVRSAADLQKIVFGQGEGWMDVDLYHAAGIGTKWVRDWRDAEFVNQMEAGFFDVFPLGAEESLSFFLPHFQKRTPGIVGDRHIVLAYPWYRFAWVSAKAKNAGPVLEALQKGFRIIARNGSFEKIWRRHRRGLPDSFFTGRRVVRLENPHYGEEIVGPEYRHLLLVRQH
jgi:hypothetical protein